MNIVVDNTCVLPLVHPLGADLDLGPHDVAVEHGVVLQPEELAAPVRIMCSNLSHVNRSKTVPTSRRGPCRRARSPPPCPSS